MWEERAARGDVPIQHPHTDPPPLPGSSVLLEFIGNFSRINSGMRKHIRHDPDGRGDFERKALGSLIGQFHEVGPPTSLGRFHAPDPLIASLRGLPKGTGLCGVVSSDRPPPAHRTQEDSA